MQKKIYFIVAVIAAAARLSSAQDDGEQRIRKALEGRQVLVHMDLPAVDSGIAMVFDDINVSFDQSNYDRLVKEYGVATRKDSKARITGVRITPRGIEIDLDGGGSPGRDWMAGSFKLEHPADLARSDREVELEKLLEREPNAAQASTLRAEMEAERQSRLAQDERNRQAFYRVAKIRSDYLKENRKNWGTKLIVVIRSKKEATSMRDLVRSLAKYVEIMPREAS